MKIPARVLPAVVIGPLLLAPAVQAPPNLCRLLKPADLTELLGGAAAAKPIGGSCSWTATPSTKKLTAAALKAAGPAAAMAYDHARNAASKGEAIAVTDEAGIGDKAFATLQSFGVVMVILKQGRLLEMQFFTGGPGTAKDVATFRPVATKAIAVF